MTIHEQLFLAGAPVVGFGDAGTADQSGKPIAGLFIGAIGGAVLGALVGKGVGTVVGAVIGGISGTIVGAAVAKAPTAASAWRRVQALDNIKAGQELAIAITGLNGTPLPVTLIVKGDRFSAGANPNLRLSAFPPGAQLPSYWPTDDDLGTVAYRYKMEALTNGPLNTVSELPSPNEAMFKAWVRDKP